MQWNTSDGVRLEYRIDGQDLGRKPILLLNGLFGDMPFWDPMVNELGKQQLCIRMDHRGVGESERWTGHYTYERYAADAIELLNYLGILQVHAVGLCHGGMVGAVIARDNPQRLASLTLQGTRLLRSEKARLYDQQRREVLVRDGVVEMSWRQTPHIFGESFLRNNAPWLRAMAEKAPVRMNVDAAVPMVDALIDFELEASVIQSLRVPALFLSGSEDGYAPPWMVKQGADLWPHAQYQEIPDCAHIMTREQPEIFIARVQEFIAERE